jgi:murein DD-endopeptidase MepM/ murein hydrolase activator NlpD
MTKQLPIVLAFFAACVGADAQPCYRSPLPDRTAKLSQLMTMIYRGDVSGSANVSQDYCQYNPTLYPPPDEGYHAGIDLAVGGKANIPFYAVAGGTVVLVEQGGYNAITIYTTNTLSGKPELHKYGHSNNRLVYPGQLVYAGQPLGQASNVSPTPVGIHVHYEVSDARYLFNGQWYDLTLSDAINWAGIQPSGKSQAILSVLHLSVASKTKDPLPSVFGLRSQGASMTAAPAVVYQDVVQGQTASFRLNVYPNFSNMPVVVYALNLPPNLDMSATGWMPMAVSGSLYYPGYSTLTLKPTTNTAPGYYYVTLRAMSTDGSYYDNWVTVNVKPAQTPIASDPKAQALADLKARIGGVGISQILEQYYYENLNWSYPYELRYWYAVLNNGNWTLVFQASNKTNRNDRYWAYDDTNWNWHGWFPVQ